MWWPFSRKGPSGFSYYSTAEEVTEGIDGSGLTAIVTGASSGIGAETARVLALRGVNVIMAVRNMTAGREVREQIMKEIPAAKVDTMELDLSLMQSVRKFASDYDSSGRPLNLLINNAGVFGNQFMLSKDNIELQFATNHLGHFLLSHLLLDNMKKTASHSGKEGRIVNVSSEGHRLVYREGIRFEKLSDQSGYNRFGAYGQSKLANILHANELSRRLKEEGAAVTANSLHPGLIVTKIFRYDTLFDSTFNTFGRFFSKTVSQGAATTCYVAIHPQVEGITGEYFNNSNLATPNSKAQDAMSARKLWDLSMNFIK